VGAAVGAIGVIVSFPASGHAAATSPTSVWIVSDALHMAAMIVWLGGLVVFSLGLVVFADTDVLSAALKKFSMTATVTMPVLIVTGTAQTLRLAGGVGRITSTDWGRTLLVKLTVVSVIVAVAAVSRWLLLNDGVATIRRLVTVEAVLGVIVLALAASLVSLPPRPPADSALFTATLTEAGTIVDVTVSPGRVGQNEMHLVITPAGGSLQPTVSATARMSLPDLEVPNTPVALVAEGANHYSGTVTLPFSGTWVLEIIIEPTPGNTLAISTPVPIPHP
jgi:copper transport protein